MKRIDHFAEIKHRAIYKRAFTRLTLGELQFCIDFIAQNDQLDFHDFAQAANRAFMDKPKTKNFSTIIEFLNVANLKHRQHLENGAQ
jgi:hypothetical protein